MAMSKKHYEETARIIASTVRYAQDLSAARRDAKTDAAKEIAEGMASMFGQDNGRFDPRTFMAACGFGAAPHSVAKRERFWLWGERVQVVGIEGTSITVRHTYGTEETVTLSDLRA